MDGGTRPDRFRRASIPTVAPPGIAPPGVVRGWLHAANHPPPDHRPADITGGATFEGTPRPGGARDRRLAAAVLVVVSLFLGVAIAKPWGASTEVAAPTSRPSPALLAAPPSAAPAPIAPSSGPSTAGPRALAAVGPLPVSFATRAPPPTAATWSGLRWRRLAPDDPLRLVTSITRWRGGYVALGWIARLPAAPIWTSPDGARWKPVPFGTPTGFWPGTGAVVVAGLGEGLVAVTETLEFCGAPCAVTYVLPVVSWTSLDGRRWAPHLLPVEWFSQPEGSAPLVAVGPGGLLVASRGFGSRLATSPGGSSWRLLPAGTLPRQFALDDLRGTSSGFVAVGRWRTDASSWSAAALWSADGRRWSRSATLATSPDVTADVGSAAMALVDGAGGLVAVGHGVTRVGETEWWQSADGHRWQAMPGLAPLGPTACTNEGCRRRPDGVLVGDGSRLVAIRGGTDAAAWLSTDGHAWRRLAMSGELPTGPVVQATVLPGGVLASDGTTTWLGQAEGP